MCDLSEEFAAPDTADIDSKSVLTKKKWRNNKNWQIGPEEQDAEKYKRAKKDVDVEQAARVRAFFFPFQMKLTTAASAKLIRSPLF